MTIKSIRKYKGFTLIEMMITIALLGFILMIGSSLTRAWIDQSQVNNAIHTIQDAVSQTKAIAIRNTNNTTLEQAAASLCIYDTSIKIVYGNCPSVEPINAIQSFPLSSDISIKDGNTPLFCMDFNYVGILVPASNCTTTATPTLTIGKNNESAEIIIR